MSEEFIRVNVENAQHAEEVLKDLSITSLPIIGDRGYKNQTGFRAERVLRQLAASTKNKPEEDNLWDLFVVKSKTIGGRIFNMENSGIKTRNLVIGSFNAFVDSILANDPIPLAVPKNVEEGIKNQNWHRECILQTQRAENAEAAYERMVDDYKTLLEDYKDLEAVAQMKPEDQTDKFEIEVLKMENEKLLNSLKFWTTRYQALVEKEETRQRDAELFDSAMREMFRNSKFQEKQSS
jgi:hypothetical protein